MDPNSSSPQAKAKRLRYVRNLANLSREAICEESKINIHTLAGWENGRFNGLSRSGAEKVLKRISQEGVHCAIEWLLFEIGAGPVVNPDFKKIAEDTIPNISLSKQAENKENIIISELLTFRQLNQNAVDYIVDDDGMFPNYQMGDYVAGIRRFKKSIRHLIGYDCIVHMENGKILFRNLRQGPHSNTYSLVCNNPFSTCDEPVNYNVKLVSAAAVIWHRRKDYTQ